ncbi:MAG: HDOD domain-containing protein [Candidatus Manganitrophaceae bacterium]|nr:MAG: HDOD domain-containing protein [Candidatus Manganitrophaceae bacterium]
MEIFIARQPIFDRQQQVYAYELLFRSSLENFFNHSDLNHASSKVALDSFFILGIDTITGGRKAFINVTREMLVNGYVALLPREMAVVEILEVVEPDAEVLAACRKLKQAGYLIALDDFVDQERYRPLVELADIIKVDFLTTDKKEQKALVERFAPRGIQLAAEKVETREVLQEAMQMGYTYFQGYFFSKPVIISGKEIPGFKLNYLRILQEINRPRLDYQKVEEIMKTEMSLSYKLLRYINSAFFGWRVEIRSIQHALVMLGEDDFKRWASFISLSNMAKDKPSELVFQAIMRGRCLELLAPAVRLPERAQDLFLMGIFSLIDAIVDRPLLDILSDMPIAGDVKSALMGEKGPLRDIYELMLSYERGNWNQFSDLAAEKRIDENTIPPLYRKALEWASQSFSAAQAAV